MKVAELCAGVGGLGLGLELAGIDVDLRWYAETDPNPARVMAHHYPLAPNLGDITKIGGESEESFALEPVELVAAGFP